MKIIIFRSKMFHIQQLRDQESDSYYNAKIR